jgi:hypothetical protein
MKENNCFVAIMIGVGDCTYNVSHLEFMMFVAEDRERVIIYL